MPNAIPDINEYRGYSIYFWSNENDPLEPVHVHICKGKPSKNATKYWINSDGSVLQDNNNSRIPNKDLKRLENFICEYSSQIVEHWKAYFKSDISFHDTQVIEEYDAER